MAITLDGTNGVTTPDLTVDTDTLTVDATNNRVGIGTASPSQPLHVVGGSVRFENTQDTYFQINTTDTHLYTAGSHPLRFGTNSTERGRFTETGDFQFNSGYGSATTAYGCRAWVSFNGTGTVAIGASGNVSSITDNGTGDYTINMTTAMPDVSYSVSASSAAVGSVDFQTPIKIISSTSVFGIYTSNGTAPTDTSIVCVQVFR